MRLSICSFVFCVGFCLALHDADQATVQASDRTRFVVLIPFFSGDISIAKPVANYIRLKLSTTFREVGNTRGKMHWGEYQLSPSSHEVAVRRGQSVEVSAHMVLWGDTYQMADGIAIQSYLSLTPALSRRKERPELWSVPVKNADGRVQYLSRGLPRDFYQFPPVLIPQKAVENYKEIEGLSIYKTRNFVKKIGTVGKTYRAFEYGPKSALITSNGKNGWLKLPYLNDKREVMVDFSAAIMRLCRGDYEGARQLLKTVMLEKSLDNGLLTDALIMLGLTEELQKRSGMSFFEDAIKLNKYDRIAASYLLLGLAANLQRANTRSQRDAALSRLRAEIDNQARLFSPDSKGFALLQRLASGN